MKWLYQIWICNIFRQGVNFIQQYLLKKYMKIKIHEIFYINIKKLLMSFEDEIASNFS